MRVLVCGSRDWTDKEIIRNNLPENTTVIIEGEADGADTLAGELADELGITKDSKPAPWEEYKRKYPYPMWLKAGFDRNQQMLDEGKPDLVLAFSNNFEESKGTKDMVNRAIKAGVLVILYSEDGEVNRWIPNDRMF